MSSQSTTDLADRLKAWADTRDAERSADEAHGVNRTDVLAKAERTAWLRGAAAALRGSSKRAAEPTGVELGCCTQPVNGRCGWPDDCYRHNPKMLLTKYRELTGESERASLANDPASNLWYEALSDRRADRWRVEAIDYEHDGQVYTALFYGPEAQQRAEEYAAFKNGAVGERQRATSSEPAGSDRQWFGSQKAYPIHAPDADDIRLLVKALREKRRDIIVTRTSDDPIFPGYWTDGAVADLLEEAFYRPAGSEVARALPDRKDDDDGLDYFDRLADRIIDEAAGHSDDPHAAVARLLRKLAPEALVGPADADALAMTLRNAMDVRDLDVRAWNELPDDTRSMWREVAERFTVRWSAAQRPTSDEGAGTERGAELAQALVNDAAADADDPPRCKYPRCQALAGWQGIEGWVNDPFCAQHEAQNHPFIEDCEGSPDCAYCGEDVAAAVHQEPYEMTREECEAECELADVSDVQPTSDPHPFKDDTSGDDVCADCGDGRDDPRHRDKDATLQPEPIGEAQPSDQTGGDFEGGVPEASIIAVALEHFAASPNCTPQLREAATGMAARFRSAAGIVTVAIDEAAARAREATARGSGETDQLRTRAENVEAVLERISECIGGPYDDTTAIRNVACELRTYHDSLVCAADEPQASSESPAPSTVSETRT